MSKGIITLCAFLVLLTLSVTGQVTLDSPEWKVNVDDVGYLGTGNTERGGDYNPATDHVLIVSRKSGLDVIVLDAATGDSVAALDVTGITGGIFSMSEIAVTNDGQIYGANLVLDATSSNVKVYRWENESSTPVNVFDGLVADGRFGDGVGVMGTGSDVDFLLTGSNNTAFAKFHWDGSTFTGPTVIQTAEPRAAGGFAPVAGEDSAWVNRAGTPATKLNLMDGGFGPAVSTGILASGHNDIEYFEWEGVRIIATGVNGSADQTFRVVDVTDPASATVMAVTEVLGPNSNGNASGFVAFDYSRGNLIVMGTNNAVAAYSLAPLFVAPPMPPMDLMATTYGPEAMLSWTLERPDVQIAYHDYTPSSGFYQAATSAYGVLFDVSAYPDASLEQLDFHHFGYAFQAGPYDYKLYVYDWTNQVVLAEIDNLVAKDAFDVGQWEVAVDLGALPVNTTTVGVFLQGETVDSFGDVWPTLSTDASVPAVAGGQVVISDLNDPFNNFTDPGNSSLGDFLMDLWLNTPSGEKVLATKGIEEGELSPSRVVAFEKPDAENVARANIPAHAVTPKPINNPGALEAVTSFNIYRGPDAGSLTLYDETSDMPMVPYFMYMDDAPLEDSMYYYGVSAVYDGSNESDIVTVDYYHPPFLTVAEARYDGDGDFLPDLVGDIVSITGIVTTPNYHSGTDHGIQDSTAGIYIFNYSNDLGLQLGDEVYVTGEIDVYNGKTEIIADSGGVFVLSTGNALPDTQVITIDQMGEDYEGELIMIENVTLVNPAQWPPAGSNGNVDITDGTNTLTMRIDKETDIDDNVAPDEPFHVVGIGDQYDSAPTPNLGYQIKPRFYTDFDPVTAIGDGNQMPVKFMVHQNYPNPFNPSTTIRFDLPRAENVRIDVFNSAGQKIRTLVNGKVEAGYQQVEWNGSNDFGAQVSSGVYIYQAIVGKNVTTKKMLLVK